MMRMIARSNVFALFVFCLAAMASHSAMGKLPHPSSWKQESDDRQFVLVMVSPLSVEEDAGHTSFDSHQIDEIRAMRGKYTQSWLYRNDGSTTPLWTVEYFTREKVLITPDGQYLIIPADGDTFAGAFFANGNSLAMYGLHNLVSFVFLKSLLTGRPTAFTGSDFNADTMIYTVTTNQGEEFSFDVTTGKMVAARSRWPMCICAALVAIVFFLGIVVLTRRKKSI